MNNFVTELHEYLTRASGLGYVKVVKMCEDNSTLIGDGKFPWINIEGTRKGYSNIPGFHEEAGDQESFGIIVSYATRDKNKVEAEIGQGGIWLLTNDLWAEIKNFLAEHKYTTQGIIKIKTKPSVSQKTWKHNGGLWLAGAELNIEFYKDVFAS